jgi:hypothetical protein
MLALLGALTLGGSLLGLPQGSAAAPAHELRNDFPLYVANYNANSIVKIGSGGTQSVFTSGGNLNHLSGLAFDGNGNLYVARPTPTNTPMPAPTNTPTSTPCARVPGTPKLLSPKNGARVQVRAVPLDWADVACALRYELVLAPGPKRGPVILQETNLTQSQYTTPLLEKGKTYYWWVRACDLRGCGPWAGWWKFTVSPTAVREWQRDDWMFAAARITARRE